MQASGGGWTEVEERFPIPSLRRVDHFFADHLPPTLLPLHFSSMFFAPPFGTHFALIFEFPGKKGCAFIFPVSYKEDERAALGTHFSLIFEFLEKRAMILFCPSI